MEPRRICRREVADSHHFDKEQDPNLLRSEISDPDLHRSEKLDPDLHVSEKLNLDLHQGDADLQQWCKKI